MAKNKHYYSMFVEFFEKNKNRNWVENLYRSLGLLQQSIVISKLNLKVKKKWPFHPIYKIRHLFGAFAKIWIASLISIKKNTRKKHDQFQLVPNITKCWSKIFQHHILIFISKVQTYLAEAIFQKSKFDQYYFSLVSRKHRLCLDSKLK